MKHFDDPLTLKRLWADLKGCRNIEEARKVMAEHYAEPPFSCAPGDAITQTDFPAGTIVRVLSIRENPMSAGLMHEERSHSIVDVQIVEPNGNENPPRQVYIRFMGYASLRSDEAAIGVEVRGGASDVR